jgi:predicted transcriptional regulator
MYLPSRGLLEIFNVLPYTTEVTRVMVDKKVTCAAVAADRKIVQIVTERDFVKYLAGKIDN